MSKQGEPDLTDDSAVFLSELKSNRRASGRGPHWSNRVFHRLDIAQVVDVGKTGADLRSELNSYREYGPNTTRFLKHVGSTKTLPLPDGPGVLYDKTRTRVSRKVHYPPPWKVNANHKDKKNSSESEYKPNAFLTELRRDARATEIGKNTEDSSASFDVMSLLDHERLPELKADFQKFGRGLTMNEFVSVVLPYLPVIMPLSLVS
eukprot:291167_1